MQFVVFKRTTLGMPVHSTHYKWSLLPHGAIINIDVSCDIYGESSERMDSVCGFSWTVNTEKNVMYKAVCAQRPSPGFGLVSLLENLTKSSCSQAPAVDHPGLDD